MYGRPNSPDYDALREVLRVSKEVKSERIYERRMSGIAETLNRLRNPEQDTRQRIILNEFGAVVNTNVPSSSNGLPTSNLPSLFHRLIANLDHVTTLNPMPAFIRTQRPDEIAGAVAHPTKPSEIRKLIRSKMVRCKRCKDRFLDKYLYERHLRDKHPIEHIAYLVQQEEEVHSINNTAHESREYHYCRCNNNVKKNWRQIDSKRSQAVDSYLLPTSLIRRISKSISKRFHCLAN